MKYVKFIFFTASLIGILACGRAFAADEVAGENTELRKKVDGLETSINEIKEILAKRPDTGELKQENAELRARVQNLETALNEVKTKLDKQTPVVAQQANIPATLQKKSIWTKYDVDLYGYIKFDVAYDSARTDTGNFARWVLSEQFHNDDARFSATANETRVGLNFKGPDVAGAKTSGKIEGDFYGGGAENKANPMLRHAFVKLEYPECDFSILAGQTSDIIAPLYPDTLNYTVGWWVGNIGYRRPQLRLTKGFKIDEKSRLEVTGGITRTIGESNILGFDNPFTGEDSGFPTMQGRMAYSFPCLTDKPTTIGVWGHWGEEEFDLDKFGAKRHFSTWSSGLDATVPICKWFSFKGETWVGKNLDTYLGGIGQGVNQVTGEGIDAIGGWMALNMRPIDKWSFNVGCSIDNPSNDDLTSKSINANAPDMAQNTSMFVNAIYEITEALQVGCELSFWNTDYIGRPNGDSIRFQTSMIYRF